MEATPSGRSNSDDHPPRQHHDEYRSAETASGVSDEIGGGEGRESVGVGGEPFGAGDGVLDIAVFVTFDVDRPIELELADES